MPREFYPKQSRIEERTQAILHEDGELRGKVKIPPYIVAFECKKCIVTIKDIVPDGFENWWNGEFEKYLGAELEAVECKTIHQSTMPDFEDKVRTEYQYNKNGIAEKWNAKKDKRGLVPPLKIDKALVKEVIYD